MKLKNLFGSFSKDIGIDIGTSHTLVFVKDKGIVIKEPSVVAINTRLDQIVAVGEEAKAMIGKTPQHITASQPLVNGVVSDFEVAEKMLKYFMSKVQSESFAAVSRPRVIIAIPLDVTEVERKAVEDAVRNAGAREVFLVPEPLAAAIGARIPIHDSTGHMVIDIGGGTTAIAVLSLNGVVASRTLRIGGDELNRNIINYVRDHFNILLGERTAEEAKIAIGSCHEDDDILETTVRGRDLVTGLPKEIVVNSLHMREAMARSIQLIVDNVKAVLENTPPELVADIYERGISLSGGSAQLRGLDRQLAESIGIPVSVIDDPLTAVVRGTGLLLEDLEAARDLFLNNTNDILR
ncbi:MAG: rod shape-determining protein [Candidatus Kerfeldbacteria bacterium]|nr:rod shape-determining protein [Candidatus Kerfeldbacteria bacterium]